MGLTLLWLFGLLDSQNSLIEIPFSMLYISTKPLTRHIKFLEKVIWRNWNRLRFAYDNKINKQLVIFFLNGFSYKCRDHWLKTKQNINNTYHRKPWVMPFPSWKSHRRILVYTKKSILLMKVFKGCR